MTMKADADAVGFPANVIGHIHLLPISPTVGFLVNYEGIQYGSFGNLEAFAQRAFGILLANLERGFHKTVANWKLLSTRASTAPLERTCLQRCA